MCTINFFGGITLMKIEIISTPIFDALGITSVSTSVEAEACRIAQLDFASFLVDVLFHVVTPLLCKFS